jgi:hypothetical protein
MRYKPVKLIVALVLGLVVFTLAMLVPKPTDTEWYQPVPPVIAPGPAAASAAPAEALVLFDGAGLQQWVNSDDGSPAGWQLADGVVTVDKAIGNIMTRQSFADFELHIEWRIPEGISGEGQSRGNSGVFLASRDGQRGYELQILDSYKNDTYVNGMAGSIYKQSIPLANASRPPGEWQSYDVHWVAPRFHHDGSLRSPARVTVWQNGVLVQKDFALLGETAFIGKPRYHVHGELPIMLQAHRDASPPISFRNIWLRPR